LEIGIIRIRALRARREDEARLKEGSLISYSSFIIPEPPGGWVRRGQRVQPTATVSYYGIRFLTKFERAGFD
jgi:hypothetical protein